MSKLRVSEVYLSIQGEGPRVGQTTVFVRFAGCNLRCPAWPCDTPHAIDPKIFSKDSKFQTPEEVLQSVRDASTHGANICFTGGEPFLQSSEAFHQLSDLLIADGYKTQEVFTNGTLAFPEWAYEELYFVMDWKLEGSGEEANILSTQGMNATRIANLQGMNEGDAVKFTIASELDYVEALSSWGSLRGLNKHIEYFYGVVWGKLEPQELIAWALRDGLNEWTYNHQLHNVIWDRTKRGI